MIPLWADAETIRTKIFVGLPRNWLVRFASSVERADKHCRKLGDSRNATLLFEVSAVDRCLRQNPQLKEPKEKPNEENE